MTNSSVFGSRCEASRTISSTTPSQFGTQIRSGHYLQKGNMVAPSQIPDCQLSTTNAFTEGQVSNILREKAKGTLLWVGLACNELEDIPSINAVRVLQDMPKGLHSLYKRLLDTALK
ncbi:hypothetical protein B0T10DRAFT_467824 [Thelonectria olida]|uniref:Uncharacterized protein n=1 Tax=Thelonectria olida TaxID=1576542 RepID=A0A9P9ADV7_9HYPO|nr:hypothetical protein B0T10DRAFT_467824 [Thelonectria olida]